MKLAWCTDIHVNFLKEEEREAFYDTLKEADGVLISGDIDEAPSIYKTMAHMGGYIEKPIYFVLGNHDYYCGTVTDVRAQMKDLCNQSDFLHYLTTCIDSRGKPSCYIMPLEGILIAGVDGWADTRYGDVSRSRVVLNDEHYIKDLKNHITAVHYGKDRTLQQWDKRKELADADAKTLYEQVDDACDQQIVPISKVIILTHIPPFPEASKHRGVQSDDNYLPFYASKATGDVLLTLAGKYPTIDFEVFCGHTHGEAIYQATPNMVVNAGEAAYYHPRIQRIITV